MTHDNLVIRRLAEQYAEICALPIQEERRRLWREHNSLIKTRVLILCCWYWGSNVERELLADRLECEDPFLRNHELWLRNRIFHESIGDDTVQEPWITVRASHVLPEACRNGNTWGIPYERERRSESGAWVTQPTIRGMEDLGRLVAMEHRMDELETDSRVSKLKEAVGDCLEVNVDRGPFYECYGGSDLCEALTYLLGLENLMIYLHEQPNLVHALVAYMRDAVLRQFQQSQDAGDWGRTNNFNMGMPYSKELPDPQANCKGIPMQSLWFFTCSQAFTVISPRMFEEFMLQYQMPIMLQFGLVSYGCCEDLTRKN